MTTQVSERLDARVIGKMPTAAAGFPALPCSAAYTAAKSGVTGFVRALTAI